MQRLVPIAHILFVRRRQPARWLFGLAAIPLAILALLGYEYGASTEYAVLAALCVFQAAWPTLFGWILCSAIYSAGAVMYLYHAMFGDSGDFGGAIIMFLLCLALGAALIFLRPEPRSTSTSH